MVQEARIVIRVGFILTFEGTGWLGGVSYFRNLFTALGSLPQPRISPVIISGTKTDDVFSSQFPNIPIIRSSILDWRSPAWVVRRIAAEVLGRDIGIETIVRRSNIRALSHEGFFGNLGVIPILGWIPDFQEHHLPQFFSETELNSRARKRSLFCKVCACLILSSCHAKRDLVQLNPQCANKTRVLHFVANTRAPGHEEVLGAVSRFNVHTPYFYLPNQFWQHKNHGVVVEALRILKDRGIFAYVVASGNTMDSRQPRHFEELMKTVRLAQVEDRFHAVGVISYPEVLAFMAGAVAVINPSLFEGWSTTVEEAKSMGKRVLLSDIPVHREQDPARGCYFSPDRPEELARLMEEALVEHDSAFDRECMRAAQESLPARLQKFALEYEDMVLEQIR